MFTKSVDVSTVVFTKGDYVNSVVFTKGVYVNSVCFILFTKRLFVYQSCIVYEGVFTKSVCLPKLFTNIVCSPNVVFVYECLRTLCTRLNDLPTLHLGRSRITLSPTESRGATGVPQASAKYADPPAEPPPLQSRT